MQQTGLRYVPVFRAALQGASLPAAAAVPRLWCRSAAAAVPWVPAASWWCWQPVQASTARLQGLIHRCQQPQRAGESHTLLSSLFKTRQCRFAAKAVSCSTKCPACVAAGPCLSSSRCSMLLACGSACGCNNVAPLCLAALSRYAASLLQACISGFCPVTQTDCH
jgi:hypothetical protein